MKPIFSAMLLTAALLSTPSWATPLSISQLDGFDPHFNTEAYEGGNELSSWFAVNTDYHIDTVRWAGMVNRSTQSGDQATLDYVVRFYSDALAGPDQLIAEQQVLPSFSLTVRDFNADGTEASESGVFSTGLSLDLAPGHYWLSIQAKLSGSALGAGRSIEPGTEGVLYGSGGAIRLTPGAAWIPMNEGVTFYEGRGQAFALEGSIPAVPEPQVPVLVLMGWGLVQLVHRYRQRHQSGDAAIYLK